MWVKSEIYLHFKYSKIKTILCYAQYAFVSFSISSSTHLRMDGAIKNPTMSHDSSYGLTSGVVELDPNYVVIVFYPC